MEERKKGTIIKEISNERRPATIQALYRYLALYGGTSVINSDG